MSVIRTPWPTSCSSPLVSCAVPLMRGAATVPATCASSATRPLARRPPAVSTGSSSTRSSVPVLRRSSVPAPSGAWPFTANCRAGPADSRASIRAPPPSSCAVAARFAGGTDRPEPERSRTPVAVTRMVPFGCAGVPVSRASTAIAPSGRQLGRSQPRQVRRSIQRSGEVQGRRQAAGEVQHRFPHADPYPVDRDAVRQLDLRRRQQPCCLPLRHNLQRAELHELVRRIHHGCTRDLRLRAAHLQRRRSAHGKRRLRAGHLHSGRSFSPSGINAVLP